MKNRRRYSPEFKLKLLKEMEAGARVEDLAKRENVSTQSLYIWKHNKTKKLQVKKAPKLGAPSLSQNAQLLECYAQIGRLTVEVARLRERL